MGVNPLAIIAGLWILAKVLSNPRATFFRCPICRGLIREYTNPCPFCGTSISWGNPNPNQGMKPIVQSPNLWRLRFKILGSALIFSLVMTAYCTISEKEPFIWSHLSSLILGYLGGNAITTISPENID